MSYSPHSPDLECLHIQAQLAGFDLSPAERLLMPPVHKPLTIPPAAKRDEKAMEMVRGWIAESGLHCTLNVGHWHNNSNIDERRAWGILLADMARHIANAMHEMAELDPQISLQKVVAAFNEEIAKPGSEQPGEEPEEEAKDDKS